VSGKIFTVIIVLVVTSLYIFCANISEAIIVTDGLVSIWTFDASDMQGDTAKDAWGENDGTVSGEPQKVPGKIEEALQFDGAADQVNCGNDASLDITGEITIDAWFYPTGSGDSTFPRIADKSNDPGYDIPGYKVYLRPSENYVLTLSAGGTHEISTLAANADAWNYVAFVIDGKEWQLFLNGNWERWTRGDIPSSVANPLCIGNSPVAARHFEGVIDEVKIYSRALSEEEVQQNYESESNILTAVEPASKLASTWASIKAGR